MPDLLGVNANGKGVRRSDFAGKNIILYFYPKDNTPGCTKEAVGWERTINGQACISQRLDGGLYHFHLFMPQQTAVASMRIESQHSNTGGRKAEITTKRVIKRVHMLFNYFLCYRERHLAYGEMGSNKCHTHHTVAKHHEGSGI